MTRRVPLRRRLGLKRSLVFSIAGCLSVLLIAAFLGAYWLVARESYRTLDLTLVRSANELARVYQRGETIEATTDCQWLSAPPCAQVADTADPGSLQLPLPPNVEEIAAGEDPPAFQTGLVDGYPVRLYTAALTPTNDVITVGYRADSIELSLERTRWILFSLGILSVLVSTLAGYLITRTNLRDLKAVTRTADFIAHGHNLDTRIGMPGNDELARLANSFDGMVESLRSSLAAQKQLVADASHELRTPLTAIQANADLVTRPDLDSNRRAKARTNLIDAVQDMAALVTDIVELARGNEPDPFTEDICLDELLTDVAEDIRRAWPQHTLRITAQTAVITGNRERLYRLISNILSNAAKYSPASEPISAALTTSGRTATLTVRDRGTGVPHEDRGRIFDRFYRAAHTRNLPGSGLGLAAARQIAAAHDATLHASWPADGGTRMIIVFPLSTGWAPENG